MTTTVVLVRHGAHGHLGHTLSGRMAGLALTREGQCGATRVAAHLARRHVGTVYASPVQRAQETGAIIAAALGTGLITAEALNEIDFGAWTGRSFASLQGDPAWDRWNQARDHHGPPDGETMLQVQLRVASWLSCVAHAHPGGTVVAVSHADVIKAALAHALGLSIGHHHRLGIDAASMSVMTIDAWGMMVQSMNEAAA